MDHWRGVRRERTADKFLLSLASRGSAKVHTRTSVSRRLADRRHKIRRIVNQSEYRCKIGHHKTGTTQSIALYSARPLPAEYQRRAFRSIGNAHCDNFSSFSACLGQRALIDVAFLQCILWFILSPAASIYFKVCFPLSSWGAFIRIRAVEHLLFAKFR